MFDLLLYPVSEYPVTEPIQDSYSIDPPETIGIGPSTTDYLPISYLSIVFVLILLLGGGYKFSSKHKNTNKNKFQERKFDIPGILVKVPGRSTGLGVRSESSGGAVSLTEPIIEPAGNPDIETAALNRIPLSPELCEVLDIIRGHKGRITQKDLRSKLDYSEVKVSLMLSELEKRGLIRKLRNGRENILVLVDEEH